MGALDFLLGRRPAAATFRTDPCDCSCDGERWRPADVAPPASRPGVPVLDVHVAEKHDRGRLVLHDVRVRAGAGEVVALRRVRGDDASTLLRIVAGRDRDFVGNVLVDGARAADPSQAIAVVASLPTASASSTVRALVTGGQDAHAAHDTRTCALLKEVGLHAFEAVAASALSAEQAHRVALARALHGAPRALLLDAPFGDVDEAARTRLLELLAALVRRHGLAALVALPPAEARDAAATADRVPAIVAARAVGAPPHLAT